MIKSVLACDETTLLNLLLPVVHRSSRSSGFVPLGAVGYIPTPICEVETHHIRVLSAFLVSPGVCCHRAYPLITARTIVNLFVCLPSSVIAHIGH